MLPDAAKPFCPAQILEEASMKKSWIPLIAFGILFFMSSAAFAAETSPSAKPEGSRKSAKTKVLGAGAKMLQQKAPLDAVNVYLDGFHFHSGDMSQQIEAHHYCSQLNEDFIQCIIYNGNGKDALLMGVEYVISRKLFEGLPEDEKKLWHSHVYETKSGQLIAPGLPRAAEHALMEKLVSTYGKTWHTWNLHHSDQGLPLGIPELMMGFTAEGQANPALVQARDKQFGINTETVRRDREDIPAPSILPGADAWQDGIIPQLKLEIKHGEVLKSEAQVK